MRYLSALTASMLVLSTASAQQEGGAFRVTGGTEAPEGLWNDTVGIVFNNQYVGCTGTLIASDVVVTAAHCISNQVSGVVIGTTNWLGDDGEILDVVDIAVSREGDIAVLKLERESEFTPRAVGFGCVVDTFLEDGAPVAVVGYGATDDYGRQNTTQLMEGYTVVTDHDCSATSRGCQASISPGGEIGAGGDGVDACFGDSGGPLYLLTDRGDFLVGVTSRAFNDVNPPCGLGGIWVRPDAFIDWIEDEMNVDLPEPTCTEFPAAADADMTVRQDKSERVKIRVSDGDSDSFVFTVDQAPSNGTISIDDEGEVTYTPDAGYLGLDTFAVRVTDTSGFPLGSDVAVVEVEVVEGGGFLGLGCSSTQAPASAAWLLGLAALGLRRRRDQNLSA
ncbi:MAG: MYXO-CTERM domain-containing protein [Myxococcota bacterium]|jgi:MYXO-CTERM domain-containing protein